MWGLSGPHRGASPRINLAKQRQTLLMLRKPNSFGFNPARLVRLGGSSVRQTSDLEPKPTDFGRIGLQVTTSQIQDMA